MCQQLDDIRQSLRRYAAGFDASGLSCEEAGTVVSLCSQIVASASTLRALAAAHAAQGTSWRRAGYRSAAEQLAHASGSSNAAARRELELGRRLGSQPEVTENALAGELSPTQVAMVAEGAEADPTKARELVETARRGSLAELGEAVSSVKAAALDLQARRARIHERRSLSKFTDRDGALEARMHGHVEDGVQLWKMLDPIRRRLDALQREQGRFERFDALGYDALVALAEIATGLERRLSLADVLDLGLFPQLDADTVSRRAGPTEPRAHEGRPGATGAAGTRDSSQTTRRQRGSSDRAEGDGSSSAPPPGLSPGAVTAGTGVHPANGATAEQPPRSEPEQRIRPRLAGSPTKILVRVDLDVLLRGHALPGEQCELDGAGRIPVSVVEELARRGDTFLVGVLTRSKQIVGVYHHRRRASAHQVSALEYLYPTCAAAGCDSRAGLQKDHREDWSRTHFTVFDLLDLLCPHHHRLKTQKNWQLVTGTGKRPFVPPDDPRHPSKAGMGERPRRVPTSGRAPRRDRVQGDGGAATDRAQGDGGAPARPGSG